MKLPKLLALLPALMISMTQAAQPGDQWTEPTLGMAFVYISPGEFMMGSPLSEANRYDDEQPHRVVITHGFWLGQYEVTFAQYEQFTRVTKYAPTYDQGWGRDSHPVINVRWNEAAAFAQWLSAETGQRYRLPTEAEWEYAARAGTVSAYSFGDDPAQLGEYAWNGAQAQQQSHPVGEKKPNPWGLYDMHGNVWEWTASEYAEQYNGMELQQASFTAKKQRAVARGGAWYFQPKSLRSADRRSFVTDTRRGYIGFRLLREE